ncbi:cytochrome c family protein [Lysobacter enzymogenes]|uniref:Cytochrome c family protein n=1 Tax=Lysobacter enzymogenes TaxID=69 RepID=A0AAU9AQP4_LYSEN|nr:cytochrome c family protein [Lysobacter enzymogenes]
MKRNTRVATIANIAAIPFFAALLAAMFAMFPAASPATAASAEPAPSAQSGKKHFIRCAACHSTDAADRSATGPHLNGIVGRTAASLPHFAYTSALRAQDFKWSEPKLDAFLKSPHSTHPGMCLTFNGLAKAEDRAALIAYLKDPAG